MDSLTRLNELYDRICGRPGRGLLDDLLAAGAAPPPSLEALIEWVGQHRELSESTTEFQWLDAALENLEEARRQQR